jgi:SnoaL-like domain
MTGAADDAARFVDQFAQGWALPKPDAFFEYFAPLIAPEATFRQPLFPTAVGPEGFTRTFQPLFELIPDLVANVQRWAAREDAVFIERPSSAPLTEPRWSSMSAIASYCVTASLPNGPHTQIPWQYSARSHVTQVRGLEPFATSSQCRFATTVLGNALTTDDERASLTARGLSLCVRY